MEDDRNKWLLELELAKKSPRNLTKEDDLPPWDQERCVICDQRTLFWLHPENAPICTLDCVEKYLQNPCVYDPRELYGKSETVASVVTKAPKPKKRRRRKPGRWDPSDADIAAMQERVAKQRQKD